MLHHWPMSRVNQSNKPEINLLLLPWEIFMLQFESCRAIWTRLLTHRGKNIPSANRNIPCLCQNKTTQHCQRPEQAVSCPHWTSRAVLECWLIFRVCNFGELQTTEVQENSFGLKLSQLGPVFAPWSLQNQATQPDASVVWLLFVAFIIQSSRGPTSLQHPPRCCWLSRESFQAVCWLTVSHVHFPAVAQGRNFLQRGGEPLPDTRGDL